jgi:antibiotic biosynthesis monooxygenase (ABM) superfamily enzyme
LGNKSRLFIIKEERKGKMIKVIEGYELKRSADIQPLFLKLRSNAMTFPGFISAEHIRSVKGSYISALLYDWAKLEDWAIWESSKLRNQLLHEAEALFVSKARITIYEVVPTSAWTYPRVKS